jgi:UDP-glucose 4-epimerase
MKIAVTGGAGFIGSNLVKKLMELNHDVIVIDDLSTGLPSNLENLKCNFQNISIIDNPKLNSLISSCEAIFHFAARGSVPRSILDPVSAFKINAIGTLNILEIARNTGAHVIFSSSSSVYGLNTSIPKVESTWTAPSSPYAASKLSAEGLLSAYANSYNIPVTNLRFFNVYGPFQRPDHPYAAVIPKWIWQAMHGKPIEIFGDGEQTRDFTFVDTVIDVATASLFKVETSGQVINLAYGNQISLNEIKIKLNERFPKLVSNYSPKRAGDVEHSQNNPEKILRYFPNVIPTNFDVGFEKTFNWLKSKYS